jgi:alkylation response protein AidB-like acyl-CoA dehydrogenase
VLKLEVSASLRSLRDDFRKWLKGEASFIAAANVRATHSLEEFIVVGREWQERLFKERWVGLHWPVEFGGRGLTLIEEAVIQGELAANQAPQILGLFGLTMVGPVLIKHGTLLQQQRFLRKILSGEEIWCQGFSEPNAGSDLTAISTRAERDSDGYRIYGSKIWTSFAQIASWCFLLTRTTSLSTLKEGGEGRHAGLSYLVVEMKRAEIKVQPLKQITGDDEFNQLFFDGVKVPFENLIGEEGDGWRIAIATLMHERMVLTFKRHVQSETLLRKLLAISNNQSVIHHVVNACAVRALSYEHVKEYASGKAPGPEGSLDKLFWSETFQELCTSYLDKVREGNLVSDFQFAEHQYLYSRGRSIAAGTSEIQRTIIADRILKLPRSK